MAIAVCSERSALITELDDMLDRCLALQTRDRGQFSGFERIDGFADLREDLTEIGTAAAAAAAVARLAGLATPPRFQTKNLQEKAQGS